MIMVENRVLINQVPNWLINFGTSSRFWPHIAI